MEELIITNCATDTSMYAEVPARFHKSDVLAASVEPAWRAGASIVHIYAAPTAEEFLHRVKSLPKDTFYATSVTGPTHLALETMAVFSGGHVRVGTEDEPYLKPGVLGDNVDHVARIAAIAGHLGPEIATVEDARALLQIPRR